MAARKETPNKDTKETGEEVAREREEATDDIQGNPTSVDWKVLRRAFPKESHKTKDIGRGRSFTYVDGATVIRRLIQGAGNLWSFEIVGTPWKEKTARGEVEKVICRLTIDGTSREHVGVQELGNSGADAEAKGAVTDALKKCATLFGIGLELYGPDYDDSGVNTPATPVKPQESSYRQQDKPPVVPAPRHAYRDEEKAAPPSEVAAPSRGADGAPLTDSAQLKNLHVAMGRKGLKNDWLMEKSVAILGDETARLMLERFEGKPWRGLSRLQVNALIKELNK